MCVLACISYASLLHIVLDPEVLKGDQADAKDWTARGWVPGDLYGSTPGECMAPKQDGFNHLASGFSSFKPYLAGGATL